MLEQRERILSEIAHDVYTEMGSCFVVLLGHFYFAQISINLSMQLTNLIIIIAKQLILINLIN